MKRTYAMTCKNPVCANYKKPLEGKICQKCKRSLSSAEVTVLQSQVAFEQPYVTKYQAPCLKVEINEPLQKALQLQANQYKKEVKDSTNDVPELHQALWTSSTDFTALHSIQHQIVKAVPLVVLSSSLDVDAIVTTQKQTKTIAYFYDTCSGGNGAAKAIFSDLPKFATKAYALAAECDCEAGCPSCLHSSRCSHHNEALHKNLGLFLLDAISGATHNID